MSADAAHDIADYLNTLPNTSAAPVIVEIGAHEHAGALYVRREGERAQRAIYVLGHLPASYKQVDEKMVFLLGRSRWTIDRFFDARPDADHPFGRMFELVPTSCGIDPDTGKPYRQQRVEISGVPIRESRTEGETVKSKGIGRPISEGRYGETHMATHESGNLTTACGRRVRGHWYLVDDRAVTCSACAAPQRLTTTDAS